MTHTPPRQLSWYDSTSIIVGIIIGAGIYLSTPAIASSVENGWQLMGLWLVGGLFSLCGSLCYAELATAYPRDGGDYVYLNRAYGKWAGFLFGWLQLWIVRPGDIAVMGFAFATHFRVSLGQTSDEHDGLTMLYAVVAVIVLTLIQIAGVQQGKRTQNFLTLVKLIGLLAIIAIGFWGPPTTVNETVTEPVSKTPLSIALIFVLFAYGGWNEMAYIAAEVKDPKRNLVRSLVSGTCVVTGIYLLINAAFLHSLGLSGMARSTSIAADTIVGVFPHYAPQVVNLLIALSALGAVNGLILTGSRITYAMGSDYSLFQLLGRWNDKTQTPVWSLSVQGLLAATCIVILGSFDSALVYTASAVYTFYLATTLAVVVLRWREPNWERPYRITAYPLPVLVMIVFCGYLIYSAAIYRPVMIAVLLVVVAIGLGVYLIIQRDEERRLGGSTKKGGYD